MAEACQGTVFERGALFLPNESGKGLLYHPDGLVAVEDGQVRYAGSVEEDKLCEGAVGNALVGELGRKPNRVILPGTVSTHSHVLQPPGIPGELWEEHGNGPEGWLPLTLRFETLIKEDPERAKAIAEAKFKSYVENGITGALEYTTSSERAVEIVLDAAKEAGLESRVKVGYVCMDQGVDGIDGVSLETSVNEAVEVTERLLNEEKFKGKIVVIDRFPIACSSKLRQKLVKLAKKYGARYETHANESEGEASSHEEIYHERILATLFKDGVFESGMIVGLGHGIHVLDEEFRRLEEAIRNGCDLTVHACPNSNMQLRSHTTEQENHVPFPLEQWRQIGARVAFGLDNGGGRGRSIFGEALAERARLHEKANGKNWTPGHLDLLEMATVSGAACLGLDDGLKKGAQASYVVVKLDSVGTYCLDFPEDAEKAAGLVIDAGQDSRLIQRVVVDGAVLKDLT
jgi:cytosine/adenosine deaminase-related metal-dependent hydrolase